MKVKVWSIEIDEIEGSELSTLVSDLGRMLGARQPVTVTPAPVAQLEAGPQGKTATPPKPVRKGGRKPGPKPKKGGSMQTTEAAGQLNGDGHAGRDL